MLVAHIDELIGYDVVAIMCGSWRSHSIAVDVKDARGDGEEGQKLQGVLCYKKNFLNKDFPLLQWQTIRPAWHPSVYRCTDCF